MLRLHDITKDYVAGDSSVHALRGIDIEFRKSEFVAILGPSGCGKTTLLNIIGGLDRYTSGEMTVNGRRTEDFADADWDTYRNHSIGFVFQSYNLIPHQTVLSNVELALTLSGVSKAERRSRAVEALTRVGLGDQLTKKPNQMSGGQMQRVAIARALVNDPEILLADEPTGALDTENSLQIMEILKEISKDRLIIMVTHNPDLAADYATRTVRLLDGEITDDSDPYKEEANAPDAGNYKRHTSMKFRTALALSCNNLLTKKTRTFLTAFAGSIGIIGIALILSLSNGIQIYINQVQEDTLSSYPITLQSEMIDISSFLQSPDEDFEGYVMKTDEELGQYVYSNDSIYEMFNRMNSIETTKNNLSAFKTYLDTEKDGKRPLEDYASSIKYEYSVPMNIYVKDTDGNIVKADALSMMQGMMTEFAGGDTSAVSTMFSASSAMSMYSGLTVWQEMLPPSEGDDGLIAELLTEQYDLLYGSWPESYDEVVLIVDAQNRISGMTLYSLGLMTSSYMSETIIKVENGESITNEMGPWSFEEMCACDMRLVLSADNYVLSAQDGTYADLTQSDIGLSTLYSGGIKMKISGIVRANPDALSTAMTSGIGYTMALTDHLITETLSRDIVKKQLADPKTDVITGLPFKDEEAEEPTAEEIRAAVDEYLANVTNAEAASIYTELMAVPTDEYLNTMVDSAMAGMDRASIEEAIRTQYPEYESMIADIPDETLFSYMKDAIKAQITGEYADMIRGTLGVMTTDELAAMLFSMEFTDNDYGVLYGICIPDNRSDSTYDENLSLLGYVSKDSPTAIYIYASTFSDKDEISDIITAYNDSVEEADHITYTDYVALLMSSITTILNAITYVLVAFVAISLVVSSIMIGIITYISVLERTKEIGILRSIGASKGDISRVFNAETMIVGFCSGVIGIGTTLLLIIPINIIIRALTDINNLSAKLPWQGGVILVLISMTLTLIAGLIPSRIAAKKDPVVALRTE